jgi:Predicted integral membrane protein
MLAVSWDTIRLFLHVLAATIWVGGQLVLAALVPVLRRAGVVTEAARRFNQVAWAAFAVSSPPESGTSPPPPRRSATTPATAPR